MALVAGVDCSTQATKVVIVDDEAGSIVGSGTAPHTVKGEGPAKETDPRVWRSALMSAIAETGKASEVEAISVAGQQHGLVVTGADGEPLRPSILWNDTRSAPQATALIRDTPDGSDWWARQIGIVPVASITVSKWAWLRSTEPTVCQAARGVCLPHDWLTLQLTGTASTDRGEASGTGWWSVHEDRYREDVLSLPTVDLDPRLLPDVCGPQQPAGVVGAQAAEVFGLRKGIPVGPGTGDNMGAALGLGVAAGVPVVSLGTSGTAYMVSSAPAADPSGVVAGFADATGRFLPLACTLNCTLAIDRFAEWLGVDREDVSDNTTVTVLPFLDGERTPNLPDSSGLITGLTHDTTPGEILLAAYEGAAAALMLALDTLEAHSSGLDPDAPVVLIGGGARGATWRRVVGRLSGRPLLIPEPNEYVAIGAAIQASSVLSGEPLSEISRRWGLGDGQYLEPEDRDYSTLERVSTALRWGYGKAEG